MDPMRAVIVGNGEPPSKLLLDRLMEGGPLLLCADGGADTAVRHGWTPDYIIGDLDSVTDAVKTGIPPDRLIRVDADNTGTDLQKALRQARVLGVTEATLTGVLGRRMDHSLWNLSLLKVFGEHIRLRIVDEYCEIWLVKERARFRACLGQKISLCSLTGPVVGIRTRGLKFALRREILGPGIRDGISNEVVENPVQITLEAGDLLLMVQRQEGMGEIEWEEE